MVRTQNPQSDFQLNYKYIIPYEQMECHFKQYSTSNDEYDDCLMESFDLLLSAQSCNMPYEKVIGRDLHHFCNQLIHHAKPCYILSLITRTSIYSTLAFLFICILSNILNFHHILLQHNSLFIPHFILGIYIGLLSIPFIYYLLKNKLQSNICYYYCYRKITTAAIILLIGVFFQAIGSLFHIPCITLSLGKLFYYTLTILLFALSSLILYQHELFRQNSGITRSPIATDCINKYYILNEKRTLQNKPLISATDYATHLKNECHFVQYVYPLLLVACVIETIVLTGYQLYFNTTIKDFFITLLLLALFLFLLDKLCTLQAKKDITHILQSEQLKLSYYNVHENE